MLCQWGEYVGNTSSAYTITFHVGYSKFFAVNLTGKRNTNGSDYCDYITRLKYYSNANFTYFSNTEGIHWMSIGRS